MRPRLLRLLLLALLSALVSCRGCSEKQAPPATDATTTVTAPPTVIDVEAYRLRAHVPAIAWATVTHDGDTRSGAVGLANIERREWATDTEPFEAASIAKTIIATCVMQLVEERRLDLDADVSSYLGFRLRSSSMDGETPITLRHLLTHTSSIVDLPAASALANGDTSLGAFIDRYFAMDAGVFLDAGPGTRMTYSNVGASMAALLVQRVGGSVTFADHARARIFEPLRMHSTRFQRSPVPAATGYASLPDAAFAALPPPSHALYPVVDLYASARDLGRFARAILRGGELDGVRILSTASVDEMLRVAQVDAAPVDALGWQARTFGGMRVLGHEGEDRGASTGLYLDPKTKVGAILLANGDAFQSENPERAKAIAELMTKLLESARPPGKTRIPSQDAD